MITHFEHAKKRGVALSCNASHAAIGGGCMNCGWHPEMLGPYGHGRPAIKVRCVKNEATVTNFTDGKVYKASAGEGSTYTVIDDLGHARVILPDQPCPHLVKAFRSAYSWPAMGQKVVGVFLTVTEEAPC